MNIGLLGHLLPSLGKAKDQQDYLQGSGGCRICLAIPMTMICGCIVMCGVWILTTSNCRDDLLDIVPYYPNSTLIASNKTFENTEISQDSLSQTYRTTASLEDVLAYYEENSTCYELTTSGETHCYGSVAYQTRYAIDITPVAGAIEYDVYLTWNCFVLFND